MMHLCRNSVWLTALLWLYCVFFLGQKRGQRHQTCHDGENVMIISVSLRRPVWRCLMNKSQDLVCDHDNLCIIILILVEKHHVRISMRMYQSKKLSEVCSSCSRRPAHLNITIILHLECDFHRAWFKPQYHLKLAQCSITPVLLPIIFPTHAT